MFHSEPAAEAPAEGGYYAAVPMMDSLANEHIGGAGGAMETYRFRAQQASAVTAVRIMVIANGNTGYSNQDGGIVRTRLMSDDGTADHFPSGTVLATATNLTITNPWADPSVDSFPLISFPSPYTPAVGDLLHVVFDNVHGTPVTDYCSLDATTHDALGGPPKVPLMVFIPDTDWGYAVRYTLDADVWTIEPTQGRDCWSPIMEVHYANGESHGMGYMETGVVDAPFSITGTNNMARELFTVSGGSRTLTDVGIHISRLNSGTDDLVVGLYTGGDSLLEAVNIPYASVQVDTATPMTEGALSRVSAAFTPRVLNDASTYYVRFSCASGTTYRVYPVYKSSASGFGDVTVFADGYCQKTTNGGSSWTGIHLSPSDWSGVEDLSGFWMVTE